MISTKEALKPHVYYYGFDDTSLQTLKDMKYEQAINYKITAAKKLTRTSLNSRLFKQRQHKNKRHN